jgi:hypothetical protein
MKSRKSLGTLAIGVLLAGWAPAASGAERFAGRILDMSGMNPGFAERFVLHINELSSDAEVSRLMLVLRDKGTSGLHKALSDGKQKGWIRIGGEPTPFYGIVQSRSLPDGSREVRVFTETARVPIEKRVSARAGDYAFGWIELKLDPTGKGEGRLTAAASVRVRGNELEMVGFGEKPFQLRDVRVETAE